MPVLSTSPDDATVTEINGVPLYTRTGKPKSRYSDEERLQILGATQDDLDATIDLFCPRRPAYAMTRLGTTDPRDWTTPRGRVSEREVLRHLQGDRIPGHLPRWVAPKSWEVTNWVGIDVDYRGDRADFQTRCRKVFKALNVLGVTEKRRLVSKTPSGGIHVRFFLTQPIRVVWIPQVLGSVGLREASGQVELFPRMTKGMRLPFGHVPGKQHDPTEWLKFIRAYQVGEFPLVDWVKCMKRAEKVAEADFDKGIVTDTRSTLSSQQPESNQRAISKRERRTHLGIPKCRQDDRYEKTEFHKKRYLELLSKPCSSPETVEEIWRLGIRTEGTRVAATKVLAWHLLRARRLSVSESTSILTHWVYETGAETSKDVRRDIQNGTRKVEAEVSSMIDWLANLDPVQTGFKRTRSTFSASEIDEIIRQVGPGTCRDFLAIVSFALYFLGFAKLNGEETATGWLVQIAVRGVIRKWPGCSGMNYMPSMDILKQVGLIEMTREKRQSSNGKGRPRTYAIRVSSSLSSGATMTIDAAITYAARCIAKGRTSETIASSNLAPNDTYKRIKPLTPLKKTRKESEEAAQERTESEETGHNDQRVTAASRSVGCACLNRPVKELIDNDVVDQPTHDESQVIGNVPAAFSIHEPAESHRERLPSPLPRRRRWNQRLRSRTSVMNEFAVAEKQRWQNHVARSTATQCPSLDALRHVAKGPSYQPILPGQNTARVPAVVSENDGIDRNVRNGGTLSATNPTGISDEDTG
jgi:hypothetical protein